MTPCEACKELNQKLQAHAPHAAQTLISSRRHTHPSKGSVETYRCSVCQCEMTRDIDLRDDRASWEL